MSRIGNAPIAIPDKVEVAVDGQTVTVKGPKGELTRTIHEQITVAVEDGSVVLSRASEERPVKALHGLSRALVNNMVVGVTEGFSKELTLVGVGFRAAKKGSDLELQVGFSHPVLMGQVDGIDVEVPEPTKIVVSGVDKEAVGQMAANIRDVRPPEPYKGKGIRYVDEYVARKSGKAGV